jgi:hypothetical protein
VLSYDYIAGPAPPPETYRAPFDLCAPGSTVCMVEMTALGRLQTFPAKIATSAIEGGAELMPVSEDL